jgi:hypothetical protein
MPSKGAKNLYTAYKQMLIQLRQGRKEFKDLYKFKSILEKDNGKRIIARMDKVMNEFAEINSQLIHKRGMWKQKIK